MHTILTPSQVVSNLACTTKKQLFQMMAEQIAPSVGLSSHNVIDVLWEREKLGTTGVGQGIAIPHGKVAGLKGVHGFFARLAQPIEFEAVDDRPVDLVFMLLAPADAGADHLQALGLIAKIMREASFCAECRKAKDSQALYSLLARETAAEAA